MTRKIITTEGHILEVKDIQGRLTVSSAQLRAGNTSLTIPDNEGIECIGNNVFYRRSNLNTVTLPNKLKEIGDQAFLGCNNLITINFRSGLKKIGNFAFLGCVKLANIVLPAELRAIGCEAFRNCEQLTSVVVPALGSINIGRNCFLGTSQQLRIVQPELALPLPFFNFYKIAGDYHRLSDKSWPSLASASRIYYFAIMCVVQRIEHQANTLGPDSVAAGYRMPLHIWHYMLAFVVPHALVGRDETSISAIHHESFWVQTRGGEAINNWLGQYKDIFSGSQQLKR